MTRRLPFIPLAGIACLAGICLSCRESKVPEPKTGVADQQQQQQPAAEKPKVAAAAEEEAAVAEPKAPNPVDAARIKELRRDPTQAGKQLQELPGWREREPFVKALVAELRDPHSPLTPDQVVTILKGIDANAKADERAQFTGPPGDEIVAKIGTSKALQLLGEVKFSQLKTAMRWGIGANLAKEYGDKGDIDFAPIAGLPAEDRTVILTSIGDHVEINDAVSASRFLAALKLNDEDKPHVALSAVSKLDRVPPMQLIEEALKPGTPCASVFFRSGFMYFHGDDTTAAVAFLREKKATLPPDFYQIAVKDIVTHLENRGDTRGAEEWKKELR
jgi:hypothetical protein